MSAILIKHFIWIMCIRLIKRKHIDLCNSSASQQVFCIFWDAVQHQRVICYWHPRPLMMGQTCSPQTSVTNYPIAQDPRKFMTSATPQQKHKISHQRGINPTWLDGFSLLSFLSVSMISDLPDTSVTVCSVSV